jgi:CRISPR/Cas system-associated exonuclease Cas4 (RecB family)
LEKAREGKTQTVRLKGCPIKVMPASQLNIPEQLEFTTNAILIGEPEMDRIPAPRISPSLEMTPSDLGLLNACFRFFQWTRILGIAEPGFEPTGDTPQMRQGTLAHKILESGDAAPQTLAVAGLTDLSAVFATAEWQELNAACPERELPFLMNLTIRGNDCWVRGRMDAAVCFEGNGPAAMPRVVDYKYAAWREGDEEKYDIQMTAYALALMKSMGTQHAISELWYLKTPMKIIRREYRLRDAEQKLSELLSKYIDAVTNDQWPAAARGHCDRVECGVRDRCWGAG